MLKHSLAVLSVVLLVAAYSDTVHAQIHHRLEVDLDPPGRRLMVVDTVTMPAGEGGGDRRALSFRIHAGLDPTSRTEGVRIDKVRADASKKSETVGVPIERYTVTLPAGTRTFAIGYGGTIHHPFEAEGEANGRGESGTPGLISDQGVYLSGGSAWYPLFDTDRLTFTLEVKTPAGWETVSQGARMFHRVEEGEVRSRWESPEPQMEIYLIAGPFTEYARRAGRIDAMAFLRTPDPELADRYLEVTGRYIGMYEGLIGPYPYPKFALVENFWETGYGMPSFTLLGPTVVRLPFILHGSYPHEILHNWWGNGVYVDDATGNWSEGLTTYLADHLIAEQRNAGVESRRGILQKYADYVASADDFPLTVFRGRYSAATEAVGYGKTLMLFHMLRRQMGDGAFVKALRRFFADNRFKIASFDDIRNAFVAVGGDGLDAEFSQWVTRTGAPALAVREVRAVRAGDGERLLARVAQTQPGPAYRLHLPVAVHLEGKEEAYQTTVRMTEKEIDLDLLLPAPPTRLDIDPEFDLFRRLDRAEIPPALSQIFGSERTLILLPSRAPEEMRRGYVALAESWRTSRETPPEIRWDHEIRSWPADRAVWIFGWENRFLAEIAAAVDRYGVSVDRREVRIGERRLMAEKESLVLVGRQAGRPDLAVGWMAASRPDALPGLGRKLPHYGRYSYLAFEGSEPTHRLSGQWSVIDSPMSVPVQRADGPSPLFIPGRLAPRKALASLP